MADSAEVKLTLVPQGFQLDVDCGEGVRSWCFDFEGERDPKKEAGEVAKLLLRRYGRWKGKR